MLASAIAFVLFAGGTFTHWRAENYEALIAGNLPGSINNLSDRPARVSLDIPPEAFHRQQPPIDYGYNAHTVTTTF
jgi:hypothetical protein